MRLAATIATLLVAQPLLADTALRRYLWENRPILVFAERGDPRLAQQLALFEVETRDLTDRKNVVIVETEPTSRLWQRYQPDGFTVILIGLDGAEKFRSAEVTDPDMLSTLIDTMPMRRQELMRRGEIAG
ncbi:MAG: DUF4174 domain-containing protein [Pseudomonadota bacterium]